MIVRKAQDVEFEILKFGDKPRGLRRKWLVHNGIGDDSYGHRFAVREFIREPGERLSMHWHKYVEALYIISGRVKFCTETEEVELGPGDLVYTAADEVHGAEVIGDEPVHSICCIDCVDGGRSCDKDATDLISRK